MQIAQKKKKKMQVFVLAIRKVNSRTFWPIGKMCQGICSDVMLENGCHHDFVAPTMVQVAPQGQYTLYKFPKTPTEICSQSMEYQTLQAHKNRKSMKTHQSFFITLNVFVPVIYSCMTHCYTPLGVWYLHDHLHICHDP